MEVLTRGRGNLGGPGVENPVGPMIWDILNRVVIFMYTFLTLL